MDRSQEWLQAVEQSCRHLEYPESTVTQIKSKALLKSKRKSGAFLTAAVAVLQSIQELRNFIKLHQEGYLGEDVYSDADKDQIEVEVGSLVKECTARVNQLKDSVLAAAAAAQAQSYTQQQTHEGPQPAAPPRASINEQTAAHRHGVVLSIAERLHRVSARFDECRAQRYMQISKAAANKAKPLLRPSTTTASSSSKPGGKAGSKLGPGREAGTGLAGSGGGIIGNGQNIAKAAQTALVGSAMFKNIKGVTQAVIAHAKQHSGSSFSSSAAQTEGGASSNGQSAAKGKQVQVQAMMDAENDALVAQLTSTAASVHSVERTVREIATLNQLFSAAVLHQAEAIETIYTNAVDASLNFKKGNVEIRKTIAVNRSAQKYMIVLLLTATLGLLFFDWFNS